MKNFVDWLTEHLSKLDEGAREWNKKSTLEYIQSVHATLISDSELPYIGKHYGDCTNENVSCIICEYQNWLQGYEDYCRNFK